MTIVHFIIALGLQVFIFIIALGLLVFIHEFGHFIVAKKQGIGVEVFSIGFGPKIFSVKRGETVYMLSALPFGGYVKLKGEDPDSEEAKTNDPKSYSTRPIWHRVKVVFAGPAMNLILSLVLMPIVFILGRYEPAYFDQKPVVIGVRPGSAGDSAGLQKGDEILKVGEIAPKNWKEVVDYVLINGKQEVELQYKRQGETVSKKVVIQESAENHAGTLGVEPGYFIGNDPVVDEIAPASPADAAGMKKGDEIVKINGEPITTWTDMSDHVSASEGKNIAVTVRRGGESVDLMVSPKFDDSLKRWILGVRKDSSHVEKDFVLKKYGLADAIKKGTQENLKLAELTFSVLGRLVTFQLSYKTLGGPIRIAQASAAAAKSGLADFLYFLAFLSMQLGVLNLLPMPVLDGGHLLFFGIEALKGKPPSMKIRQTIEQIGFFVLITLMILVTFNDIQSIFHLDGITKFFQSIFHKA